jgi:hypothetical protein
MIPFGWLVTLNSWVNAFVVPGKAGGAAAVKRTTLMVCNPFDALVGTSRPQIVKFVGAVKW